jgi:hypothetical protein
MWRRVVEEGKSWGGSQSAHAAAETLVAWMARGWQGICWDVMGIYQRASEVVKLMVLE